MKFYLLLYTILLLSYTSFAQTKPDAQDIAKQFLTFAQENEASGDYREAIKQYKSAVPYLEVAEQKGETLLRIGDIYSEEFNDGRNANDFYNKSKNVYEGANLTTGKGYLKLLLQKSYNFFRHGGNERQVRLAIDGAEDAIRIIDNAGKDASLKPPFYTLLYHCYNKINDEEKANVYNNLLKKLDEKMIAQEASIQQEESDRKSIVDALQKEIQVREKKLKDFAGTSEELQGKIEELNEELKGKEVEYLKQLNELEDEVIQQQRELKEEKIVRTILTVSTSIITILLILLFIAYHKLKLRNKALNVLDSEKSQVILKLEQTGKDKEAAIEKLNSSLEENRIQKEELQAAYEVLAEKEEEIRLSYQKLDLAKKEINEKEDALLEANAELIQIQDDLYNTQKELDSTKFSLDQTLEELENTQELLTSTNVALENNKSSLKVFRSKLVETQKELEVTHDVLGVKKQELVITQDRLEEKQRELVKTLNELVSKEEELLDKNMELDLKVDILKSTDANLKTTQQELDQRLTELDHTRSQLSLTEDELNKKQEQLEETIQELVAQEQKTEEVKIERDIALKENTEKEKELKQTQEKLIYSDKMATIGQMAAGVAHEVNSPLGAIRASVNNINFALENNNSQFSLLFNSLIEEERILFFQFLNQLVSNSKSISPIDFKEEREIKQKLESLFEEKGVPNARKVTKILVEKMNVYQWDEQYESLLLKENNTDILQSLSNFTSLHLFVRNIQNSVDRAERIVFALKNYAYKSKSDKPVEVNLIENIETVLTLYSNQLKRGIQICKEYQFKPLVRAFPDELGQVWTNLVVNAIHAMQGLKSNCTLTIKTVEDNYQAKIIISDSGRGIPHHIANEIFEPFFTTKSKGEGTGLGLHIVKDIVEKRHDGQIYFESEEGKGTIFYVLLPLEVANSSKDAQKLKEKVSI